MIDLIYFDKNIAVIVKPYGIPTQPDPTGDEDAMSMLGSALRDRGESPKVWLIHRLDRTVGGILVFARNERAAQELSRLVGSGGIEKRYLAVTEGVPTSGNYVDLLFHDKRRGKAFIVDRERVGVKRAELNLSLLSTVNDRSLVEIELITGRFHQIRAQLSNRGTPLVGDGKYGSRDKGRRTPALFSFYLSFTLFGKRHEYRYMPDTAEYPWRLFDKRYFGE